MRDVLVTIAIGFGSGVLSGALGVGGGIVTTPAIRLVLDRPALIAVGTPLPVIVPSALTGAFTYVRRGVADVRSGVLLGAFGSLFAVAGAWATRLVGGRVVLLVTAALVFYTAADVLLQAFRVSRPGLEAAEEHDAFAPADTLPAPPAPGTPPARPGLLPLAAIGAVTGVYSGFLGMGGGFVLVPMLTRFLGFEMKRAIGTSLVCIAILAVPGTITHALLGNIDWPVAAALVVGVVPGALVGARLTLGAADRSVRLAFAAFLLTAGALLIAREVGAL